MDTPTEDQLPEEAERPPLPPADLLARFRPNRGIAATVLTLLWLQAAASALLGFLAFFGEDLLVPLQNPALLHAANLILRRLVPIENVLFFVCGLCFLVWLRCAFANLPLLGSTEQRMSPARAMWGWFVPAYNLAHGWISMHQLYLDSQSVSALPGAPRSRSAPLVGIWWAAYLIRNLYFRTTGQQGTLTQMAIEQTLNLIAAVICARLIARIQERQLAQHDDLVRRIPVPPPADRLR